jgi:WD40 repeat protein
VKGSCAVIEFDIAALTIKELYRFVTEEEGKEPEQNTAVASKDGKLIATGGTDGVLKIWKTTDPKQAPRFSVQCRLGDEFNKGQREVKELMFNEDGTRVLSCDGTGKARIWDTSNGKQLFELKYDRDSGNVRDPFQIRQAKFLSNGNIVTAPSTQRAASYICVYDSLGKVLVDKRVAKSALRSIALSPSEDFLGVCMLDGSKLVFTLPDLRLLKNKKLAHDLPATGVGFVGDSTLVSGSGDRVINLMRFSKSGGGGLGFLQLLITLLVFLATLYLVLRIGVKGAAIEQGQKGEL